VKKIVTAIEKKRIFDIVVSVFCIGLFLIVGVFIAILVKSCSKGPIFHYCKRVGKEGKTIYCWKFRTMCEGADKKLDEILEKNPELQKEWDLHYKLKNDPRINGLGKILRKSSLDELPQLWNAFKGDLSIVGPRPVTEEEVRVYFRDKADKILSVRPGLTGVWQISGRNLLTFDERVYLEESYIDRQSLKLDLWIILKTIFRLFFSKGAF